MTVDRSSWDRSGWRRRNVLKIEVLKILEQKGIVSTHDLVEALNITIENAQMVLHRIYKQQLATRSTSSKSFVKSPYSYSITPRGLGRLEYLEKKEKSWTWSPVQHGPWTPRSVQALSNMDKNCPTWTNRPLPIIAHHQGVIGGCTRCFTMFQREISILGMLDTIKNGVDMLDTPSSTLDTS